MNVHMLKGKRVEKGLRQLDLANHLGISEKAMNHKECSSVNKFKANEMIALSKLMGLTLGEFNAIFFDGNLPNV